MKPGNESPVLTLLAFVGGERVVWHGESRGAGGSANAYGCGYGYTDGSGEDWHYRETICGDGNGRGDGE